MSENFAAKWDRWDLNLNLSGALQIGCQVKIMATINTVFSRFSKIFVDIFAKDRICEVAKEGIHPKELKMGAATLPMFNRVNMSDHFFLVYMLYL